MGPIFFQFLFRQGSRFYAAGILSTWLLMAWPVWADAQPVEILPAELRGAIQPQVAAAPDGNIFVAFGKGNSIYCTASMNGGKTFRPPVEVATLPKLALGMRRGPRVVATDGAVTISAISHEAGNLYSWTSVDQGLTWSKAVVINSITNTAREGLHAMAGDGKGGIYTVWLDLRGKGTELWGAASHDHGKTWSGNVAVYQSPDGHICECCHPSLSVSTNGSIRVMWRNWLEGSRDMFTAGSTDGGRTFSPAGKLGLGTWPLNACPMDGGGLAGVYSTWRRQNAVYYTDDQQAEQLLSAQGRQPVVGLGKAGPYFLWQQDSQLMLNQGLKVAPRVLAEVGAYPAIASAAQDAAPLAAWEGSTNGLKTIFAQVLK
jgi:hypothetical protein